MADSYTPILNLTLPEVGASRDTWGQKLNHDLSVLDSYVGYGTPVGMVIDFAGVNAPTGWLVCDGRTVSRVTYAKLYAVIGTLFGAGDGSSTFGLPNLCGRSTVGPGALTDSGGTSHSWTVAVAFGYYQTVLTQTQLPNYALSVSTVAAHSHGGAAVGGNHNHGTDVQGSHAHGGNTSGVGDHTHSGYTDAQGAHSHSVASWNFASGAAGGYQVPYPPSGVGYNGEYTSSDGSHQHNIATYGGGAHSHTIATDAQGSHGHNITYSGNLSLAISADGAHTHSVTLGGGAQPFVLQSPALCMTKIIFCGSDAIPPSPLTIEGTFLDLDALQQQVADLTMLVNRLLPGRAQLLSSPLRGPH